MGFETRDSELFATRSDPHPPFDTPQVECLVELERQRELERRRERFIREQLEGRGITDARVIEAFRRVPREAFVPPHLVEMAYEDEPLPIGMGQTISQPSLVAEMLAALHLVGHERVLEVGTGSGYVAALLAHLVREVDTVERVRELAWSAGELLLDLGFPADSVRVHHHDGTLGFAPNAPYDAIIVAACGPRVPRSLVDQLVNGGRLLMPIGDVRTAQRLVRVTKLDEERSFTDDLGGVRFVPLVGSDGWSADASQAH